MKVFLVKQESKCDGEVLFNVTPCKDMETAKKVMEDEVKTLLTESVHYNGIDIDKADENGDFTVERDEKRFFINDNYDDYYEEITIEEKEIV